MKRKTLKGQALLDYSLKHVKERLWDRYGLRINKDEYRDLCKACNDKNLISKEENCKKPSSIHDLFHRGEIVLFVYEKERGCITTVLSQKMLRQQQQERRAK